MKSKEVSNSQDLFVVGIGASAGGLRALEEFFDSMSSSSGAAFVVVQHLSPDFKSLMKELLERHTEMEVYRVTEGMELHPNSIYLIPPRKNLLIKDRKLSLEERSRIEQGEINFPIDLFFQSLAKSYRDRAIGVILSGSGSDGTRGLSAINEAGGIALVQEPNTAEFDGMPRSAISTGLVNQILPPRELAQLVYQCVLSSADSLDLHVNQENILNVSGVQEITEILKKEEEFDFSQYKVSTLSRRIHRRRLINNIENVEDYTELLRNSAKERKILCSDLLINVTHFFRDTQAWEIIENNVIPTLLENAAPNEELRFWVTACSTGEEAYSLAMLLDEALNDLNKSVKIKIFATDIDKNALEKASQGLYSEAMIKGISPERLQKYFGLREDRFQVVRKLREMLIFAPQDLTKDAGFTRMHFISCRNVLIYLQSNLQYHVLRSLHFSLVNQGILFLGEAENLGQLEPEFKILNRKWNIYQKRRDVRLPLLIRNPKRLVSNQLNYAPTLDRQSKVEPILEQTINLLLAESNAVVLLVNSERQLIQVCGDGSKILSTPKGKITNDVTKMVAAELQLPLNTALYRSRKEKKPVLYTGITIANEIHTYALKVFYSLASSQSNDFYLIKIHEETKNLANIDEGQNFEISTDAGNRILSLEYELQQTRENLQTLIEELETTNEEQQASNEELIASNEELQSTNEELHSVNEELHTVNIEYQTKIKELIELNYDVENLLKSTEIGVIFLDSRLRIRKFTPAIKKAISIRNTDISRPLTELHYKFDYPDFIPSLQRVIQNRQPIETEIKLKNHPKYFLMRLNPYHVEEGKCDGVVVSFIGIDEVKKIQHELQQTLTALTQSEARLSLALSAGDIGTWIWQPESDCLVWDDLLLRLHYLDSKQHPHNLQEWLNLIHPEDREKVAREVTQTVQDDDREKAFVIEYRVIKNDDKLIYCSTKGKIFTKETEEAIRLIGVTIDITEIRETERKLSLLNQELEQRVAQRTQTLADFSDLVKQIHRLATSERKDLNEVFADYLKTGCQILHLSTGIISMVKGDLYKIMAVESPLALSVGNTTNYQNTYCAEVLKTKKTVAWRHVSTQESLKEHPMYANFQLESYIGTPIIINGGLYGTLSFSDMTPREREFTQEEIEILELMAKDIGQFIAAIQTEKALKASETRFRNTFDQAAVGIAHVSPEGKFIKVNQRLCDILGYSSDRLLNLTFQDITHPEDLDLDLNYLQQMLTGQITNYSLEKRYFQSNGSIAWINLTVSLVRKETGEPEYFISVIEDISLRKEMARNLTEANQAKDNFISQMNHELRTPLNSILGFTQILQKDLEMNERQQQTLDLVASSGEHLSTIINSILEFSKIEAGRSVTQEKYFNLSQLLDEIADTIRYRVENKGLKFNYRLDVFVPVIVKGDATKLKQLLLNLLDNAIKFTDMGMVNLSVDLIEKQESTNIHRIRFQVVDTGIGISPEHMETIFEPFIHLESDGTYREGTGLGLTISQKIAQLMNTQLQMKSDRDEGTTFWFDLDFVPGNIDGLQEELVSEIHPERDRKVRELNSSRTILVVDDITENRNLLKQHFSSLGFTIAEANNGRQCLETAEICQPDIILLDILMPEMDGIDTLKHLRQHPQLKETKVIFISANAQFKPQLKAAKMKFSGFFIKPVNLQKLSDRIYNLLDISSSGTKTESTQSAIVPPSPEKLNTILESAKIGDMEEILQLSNNALENLEPEYHPFFQKITSLAESFQQYQMIQLVEKYLVN